MPNPAKKLLIVINTDWFLVSHQLPIVKGAIAAGFQVFVATQAGEQVEAIRATGAQFVNYTINRSGNHPVQEVKLMVQLARIYRQVQPDLVHLITIKPILYGSIVSRLTNRPTLNALSGFGYALNQDKPTLASRIIFSLMRLGFRRKAMIYLFQNPWDYQALLKKGILNKKHMVSFVNGSGVDLEQFCYTPLPDQQAPLKILLPARLLWDKGIKEFKEASEMLYTKYKGKIIFQMMGKVDLGNPAAITEEELKAMIIPGYFEWVRFQADVVPFFREATIICLPSYHEGRPKALLEACAIGRAIISSDIPGCRECVDHSQNGLLVPVKDAEALANAIDQISQKPSLLQAMGKAGRVKAEAAFGVKEVVAQHIQLYNQLLDAL